MSSLLWFAAVEGEAEGEEGGFHAPSMAEFFPPAIFGEGTFIEFNRIMMVRIIMVLLLVGLLWWAARNPKLVPSRKQSIVELGLDFVRVQIVDQVLGHKGKKYVPVVTVIFFTVFAMNVAGIIPLLNIAGTSVVGLPLLLALWAYVTYLAAGVRKLGLGGYLKASLFPTGVPWFMYFLITPIEALQVFVVRPVTLALRLLANMIAGHLMLVLAFSASSFLLLEGGGAIKITGLLTAVAGLGLTLFELVVALLQAYIFALLTAVYIDLSTEAEH